MQTIEWALGAWIHISLRSRKFRPETVTGGQLVLTQVKAHLHYLKTKAILLSLSLLNVIIKLDFIPTFSL